MPRRLSLVVASGLALTSSGWLSPPSQWRRSFHLFAQQKPSAVVGSWRSKPENEVCYEVDRKVVIARLPRGSDATYLRDVLANSFGAVKYVEIDASESALVVFEEPEAAAAACRTSVRVRLAGDYEFTIDCERFERKFDREPTRTVFVDNLPDEGADDAILRRVFVEGGCRDPVGIRRPHPGIAYLEFAAQDDADRAVALAGTRLRGRPLRVNFGEPDRLLDAPRSVQVVRRGNSSSLAGQTRTLETTSIKAARAAALSAAAAWREARHLRQENADLRARVPRRASWQPRPFSIRLGSRARPGDVLRLRVDGQRDLELCVPDCAGPGAVLLVRGALQCVVPRGAFPGEPLAVPLPQSQVDVIVVPPGKRPGSWLWIAYPVECLEPPKTLPPPQTAVLLPPPPRPEARPKGLLEAPPVANGAALAVRPTDELADLQQENDQLKRELAALRKLLRTTSLLLQDRLEDQAAQLLEDERGAKETGR